MTMYLLDTNIILELVLDQDRADEVEQFLCNTPPERLYLSEFTIDSIGVILIRRRQHDTFTQIVHDLLINGGIRLLRLDAPDLEQVARVARQFNLDFDDAYQYVVAERFDLIIVSFDADFDRTARRRVTPAQTMPPTTPPEQSPESGTGA